MKKVILLALAAGLFILSGCKKDNSVKDESSSGEKGAVIVNLETAGVASDVISVQISLNGQVVKVLDKNTKEYKTEFALNKETNVKIEPKFATVTPPDTTYKFVYTYTYQLGITSDGGTTWSKEKHNTATRTVYGASAGQLDGLVNYAKNEMKIVEATFSDGMLSFFSEHN